MKRGIKVGDEVMIISGAGRSKRGKVLQIDRPAGRLRVAGIAISKKHVKKNSNNPNGAILEIERPIHRSNVRRVTDES